MNFTDPKTVLSPKASVSNLTVLLTQKGEDGWSLAELDWDDKRSLAVRWNGHSGNPLGNPQSRGIPTWFVLPDEIASVVKKYLINEQVDAHAYPKQHDRIRLNPVPKRIWHRKQQESLDYVWIVESINAEEGKIWIRNISTDHVAVLHQTAHFGSLVRSEKNDQFGQSSGILNLNVQMVFEDGFMRLELLDQIRNQLLKQP